MPDNTRGEPAAREERTRIAASPEAFLASLVDREAKGTPITLPDGGVLVEEFVTLPALGSRRELRYRIQLDSQS